MLQPEIPAQFLLLSLHEHSKHAIKHTSSKQPAPVNKMKAHSAPALLLLLSLAVLMQHASAGCFSWPSYSSIDK